MPSRDAAVSAEALRKARLKSGQTQAEVARQLRVDSMRLSVWERGLAEPRPVYIPKLATLYAVPPELLLERRVRGTLLGMRLAKGLTVQEVAQRAGISGSSYHSIEHRGINPTTFDRQVLESLGECFEIPPEALAQIISR